MEFRILGPLEALENGKTVELGGAKQRALLAILLLHRNEVVSTDSLIDALWEEDAPETGRKALQVYVSQLRKALGRERLQTTAPGYLLRVAEDELDLERFERLADAGATEEALALWRGSPLSEFAFQRFAQSEIARIEELRLALVEARLDADLAAGRHAALVGELEALVAEHPLRERLRAQLMLALYRSGRQAEALEVYREARRTLVDELGIEPGRALREVEQAILAQDPALDLESPPRTEESARREQVAETTAESPDADTPGVRKTVTAIHVRAGVSGDDGAQLDPEVLRNVTARVFGEITGAIAAHEGAVEAITGDGVSAVFGLPRVHEDDPQRAVRAAKEIRARLAERSTGAGAVLLELGIGVSTGEVMTGGPGGAQGRATGEPLTACARLAREARAGEIVLDEATRRAVSSRGRDHGRFASPMVGRERERRRLHDAYEQAVGDDSCQLFTILGAAGVGKSRLAQEFLDDLPGHALVARGRCLPYGEGITFWPLLEVIKEVAAIEDGATLEDTRSRIAALVTEQEAPEALARRVTEAIGLAEAETGVEEGFTAVRQLLEAVGRERPLVVVLDDIHWGEPTFLDLVEHLADWLRGAPILLLCMARPELLDARPTWAGGKLNATSVLLEPLSHDECTELVANLLGEAQLAEEVEARIAAAAEGNPLFVEEMLSMLIDDGLLVRENGRWAAAGDLRAVPVPPTIRALLAARLDRLSDDERAVLQRAAVEGKVFHRGSVDDLASASLQSAVTEHLGSLVRKELIRPERPFFAGEDAYRFRHLLIRDAAYEAIPKEVRADLHQRHASWLASKSGAVEYDEIVAYHLEQAFLYRAELGPVDDETRALGRRAAERLGAAGRRALLRSDAPAGVNLISRAVSLLSPDDSLRVELVPNVRVVQGMTDLGWADRVLTEAVEAAATTGDRRLAAHALVQRGLLRLFTEVDVTPQETLRTAEQAIAVFQDLGDDLGLARAWRLVGQAHYLDRQGGPSGDANERALDYARRAGDRFEEREIVEWLVIALLLGPAPAPAASPRCERLLEEAGDDQALLPQILSALAALAAMQQRPDEASELIEQSRTIMNERGEWIWIVTFWWSFVHLWQDDPDTAEQELRPAYDELAMIGEKSHFSSIAHALAAVAYAQGRYEEAERLARECEGACRANDVHSHILWRSILAKVLARRNDLAEAERLAREAVAFAETTDFLLAHADALADLADVLELAGRPDEAARAIEEAIVVYERKGNLLAANRARARQPELA